MAAFGTMRKSGVDVDGYRGYRGVDVVGAWAWLDDTYQVEPSAPYLGTQTKAEQCPPLQHIENGLLNRHIHQAVSAILRISSSLWAMYPFPV